MRILVVEDEAELRKSLKSQLEKEGFACDVASDGDEGLFFAMEYPVDLAIIDIGLPGKSGLEIIQTLRSQNKIFPILLLTARDRWQDKVLGLEAGADDYLTKPFILEELLARVNALLRRSVGKASAKIEYGVVCLDTSAKLFSIAGEVIQLTAYEYRVLECLIFHSGSVLTKTFLSEHVYDETIENDSNVMEVLIGRVRKKIKPYYDTELIATVRGEGYRFVPPVTE